MRNIPSLHVSHPAGRVQGRAKGPSNVKCLVWFGLVSNGNNTQFCPFFPRFTLARKVIFLTPFFSSFCPSFVPSQLLLLDRGGGGVRRNPLSGAAFMIGGCEICRPSKGDARTMDVCTTSCSGRGMLRCHGVKWAI